MSGGTLSVERCYLLELALIMFTHPLWWLLYFKLMETLLRLSHILLSYIEHSYIFIASSLEQLEQSQQHEPTTLQLVSGAG